VLNISTRMSTARERAARLIARRRGYKATALLAALALLVGMVSVARAELSASGNLFITFKGGIDPRALPRDRRAPIAVWMSGKVRTLSGEHPPAIREITIALNRAGRLDTRGLPTCRRGQLEAATRSAVLAACRDALVGTGTYRARSTFPEQARTPAFGRILAFNAKSGGRSMILAHVYGEDPAPSAHVIPFEIRTRSRGPYRTVLTGKAPEGLSRWGYLKRISLRLHRVYTFRGRRHSYLSAPCRAPRGLKEASFKFAFTSMTFADGRELSANLTRTCKVRG